MNLFVSLSSKTMMGMRCAMAANRLVGRDGCLALGRT
jgi:hypothetical protein